MDDIDNVVYDLSWYFDTNGTRRILYMMLDSYSRWLEKHGHMDSDWYTEGNTVEEFLDEITKRGA